MTPTNYRTRILDAREECFAPARLTGGLAEAVGAYVALVDEMLQETFTAVLGPDEQPVCLIALGGYGRRELCPHSDIDLLLLHEFPKDSELIAAVVRAFWDMGLSLGCVVRNIAECRNILGEDLATDTALMESRFLCGSKALYRRLELKVIKPFMMQRRKSFVNEMLSAIRSGLFDSDSAIYVIEPNLKNGVCTLRDCQRVIWAQSIEHGVRLPADLQVVLPFTPDEYGRFERSYNFLLATRIVLHTVAERRIDVLEIGLQGRVAAAKGYGNDGAGRLMEAFFKSVRDVRHCLLSYLEYHAGSRSLIGHVRRSLSAVRIAPGLKLLDGVVFLEDTVGMAANFNSVRWMLDVFLIALTHEATPGMELLNRIRSRVQEMSKADFLHPEISAAFRALLSMHGRVGMTLSLMHDTGLVSAVIPEFEALLCKVEYDTYHEFTVDQHTMVALSLLDNLDREEDPLIQSVYRRLTDPDLFLLRLAVLLHDIGKALPGDHSYSGSAVAEQVCERLGLAEAEEERVVFLVRNHLQLSKLAFRREPEEPLIVQFADSLENRKNLDMLYILTILDIRSVGRKTWTAWKGLELQAIYERTLSHLELSDATPVARPLHIHEDAVYARLLQSAQTPGVLVLYSEKFVGFERITVCSFDRPHFFADIVGCLSSEGYNILSARLTTTDEGKVLDNFNVEPDETTRTPTEQRLANLHKKWDSIISGAATAEELLDERLKKYPVKPQRSLPQSPEVFVRIDNSISTNYTVIEIDAPDRFGLLSVIARVLTTQQVNIVSAKLSTRSSRARDVFYVNVDDRKKLESDERKSNLTAALVAALGQSS